MGYVKGLEEDVAEGEIEKRVFVLRMITYFLRNEWLLIRVSVGADVALDTRLYKQFYGKGVAKPDAHFIELIFKLIQTYQQNF